MKPATPASVKEEGAPMSKGFRNVLAVGTLLLLGHGPALAHHSVAGQFDVGKVVRLQGTVTRVDWINPHTYLYVDVKGADGQVVTWRLESHPVAMMRKAGLSRQDLQREGVPVTFEAHPARDGTAHLAYTLRLRYADGREYQLVPVPADAVLVP
jgi:Family of unknown function (DUF6152)